MTTDNLFETPIHLSPKRLWMQENAILTWKCVMLPIDRWRAVKADGSGLHGLGDTEDDALVVLAIKLAINDWRTIES